MTAKGPREGTVPMIVSVTPLDGHRLDIEFGNGSRLNLQLRQHMRTTRYYALNDPEVFRAAVTDGEKIIFSPRSSFVPDIFPREAVGMALRVPVEGMSFRRVTPMEGYRIRLEMGSGSLLFLNLESHLPAPRYRPLREETLFSSVKAEGECLLFGTHAQGDFLQMDEEELTNVLLCLPEQEKRG